MLKHVERTPPWLGLVAVVACLALGCTPGRDPDTTASGTGGVAQSGSGGASDGSTGGSGAMSAGGATGSGGLTGAGGASTTGGTGGASTASTGGVTGSGGVIGSAGVTGSAGASGSGGVRGAGGVSGSGGVTATGGSAGSKGPTYPYILSCFDDDNSHASDLMIYSSNDALNWTLLSDTGYTGPTGFMRDPSIMRHTDGKYYVAFTTPPDLSCCSDEQSFSIGSSSNLKDWTTIATVPCGVAGTKNTWSPEWFVDDDGSVHLTATLDLSIYHYEPTDTTLTKWGPPTAMNISGTLDAQVLKIGSTYHMILPNRHGTAASLDGPWTWNNSLLPPSCKEGPAMVHIGGNTWRYYCDNGGGGHESSSLTTDLFQTWTSLETLPVVGNNISQGTVIRGDTGHPF